MTNFWSKFQGNNVNNSSMLAEKYSSADDDTSKMVIIVSARFSGGRTICSADFAVQSNCADQNIHRSEL